jgi:hypothetical protein
LGLGETQSFDRDINSRGVEVIPLFVPEEIAVMVVLATPSAFNELVQVVPEIV